MSRLHIDIDLGHGGGLTDDGIMDVLEVLRDRLDEGLLGELDVVGPDGCGPVVPLLDGAGLPCGTAQVRP